LYGYVAITIASIICVREIEAEGEREEGMERER
jgi:hypothetical protein